MMRLADMVELSAADFEGSHKFDLGDNRGVDWENALHADTIGALANGKRAIGASAVTTGDHETFKYLNTLFVAFFDLLVDADGLARFNVGWLKVGHREENLAPALYQGNGGWSRLRSESGKEALEILRERRLIAALLALQVDKLQ